MKENKRDQRKAEHDAELLGRDREHEVRVAVGQDALHRALARPAPEPAAAHEGFDRVRRPGRCRPTDGSMKRLMRLVHVRHEEVGAGKPDRRGAGEPRDPDHAHAGHEEQRAPHQRDQHGLAEVRLQHQRRRRPRSAGRARSCWPACRPCASNSANSQEIRITNAGLTNSEGWMLTPASTIQRRAPFTSAPITSVAAVIASADDEDRQARGGGSERGDRNETAIITRKRRREIHRVPVHEVERVEPDAGRDRRARGEREHDAGHHQHGDRRQHQPVDGPPPVGKPRAFDARDHAKVPVRRAAARCAPSPALHSRAMVYERLTGGRFAFELQHRIAERRAADLEVAVLVVGRAGRREQHHRFLRLRRPRRPSRQAQPRGRACRPPRTAPCPAACRRTRPPPRRSGRPCGCAGNSRQAT